MVPLIFLEPKLLLCTVLTSLCMMYIHIFPHKYPECGGKYREHANQSFQLLHPDFFI
jgi:hypothetical protein